MTASEPALPPKAVVGSSVTLVELSAVELGIQRKLIVANGDVENCIFSMEELAAHMGFKYDYLRKKLRHPRGLLPIGRGRQRMINMRTFLKKSELDAL